MKKLLAIMVLGLLWSGNTYAEIYYCVDIDRVGFRGADKNRVMQSYPPKKFKANITFEPLSFVSKDLGFESFVECLKLPGQKHAVSCASALGEIFTIENSLNIDYFKYNRAQTYGRNDDIVLSYGTCEKF